MDAKNEADEDKAVEEYSTMFKTEGEVGAEIQAQAKLEMHQQVPQELNAIRNGSFDKMMQEQAQGRHSEKAAFLASPEEYLHPAQSFTQEDGLTTLEKDLDHPSPVRNSQKAYSADAPTNQAVQVSAPAPKPANDNDLTTLEKDLDHPSPARNSQKAYSADAPTN